MNAVKYRGNVKPMSLKENLKMFRERAKLTQDELALKSGVSQQVIGDVESGRTKRPRELHRIADALGITPADLDPDRFGPPQQQNRPMAALAGRKDLPVHTAAEGGAGSMLITFEPIDYVARPYPLESVKDAYAVYVVGESMSPAFDPGDMALVHPHLPPSPGRDAIFLQKDGEVSDKSALIKRIVRATTKEWHVKQFNPHKEFTLSRAEWPKCHIVIGKYAR